MPVATIKSLPLVETANCLVGDVVGDLVYITGPPVGGLVQYAKADPNVGGKHPAVAVIVEKISSTVCVVQCNGVTPDIYAGLTPGSQYWLGASGTPSLTPVSAAPQAVGVAISAMAMNMDFLEDLKPTVGGAAPPWREDEFSPTAGQVTFILSNAPTDVNSIVFLANGVAADDTSDYTVSGTTVTWLDNWFVFDTSDKVLIRYQ